MFTTEVMETSIESLSKASKHYSRVSYYIHCIKIWCMMRVLCSHCNSGTSHTSTTSKRVLHKFFGQTMVLLFLKRKQFVGFSIQALRVVYWHGVLNSSYSLGLFTFNLLNVKINMKPLRRSVISKPRQLKND